jgi:hypothetical protein
MPEHEHVVQVVQEWVGKAEEDLKAATADADVPEAPVLTVAVV